MVNIDPEFKAGFITEVRERLDDADQQLLALASDPKSDEALSALFRFFHTIKGEAGFLAWDELSLVAHAAEDLLYIARDGKIKITGDALDLVFKSVDQVRILIAFLEESGPSGLKHSIASDVDELKENIQQMIQDRLAGKKLGEILVEAGHITEEILNEALLVQKNILTNSESIGLDSSMTVGKTNNDTIEWNRIGEDRRKGDRRSNERRSSGRRSEDSKAGEDRRVEKVVKVDTQQLDRLLNAVGEFGLGASMLIQDRDITANSSDLTRRNLAALGKITREILNIGESMRMTTIRPVFRRMSRLAFDLAQKSGKSIDFSTSGEDLELDRAIVEKIGDALIHLIRNSIDHGIEDSETRKKNGKNATGQVKLSASQRSGNVFIEILDDGRGLDRDHILRVAMERGLVSPGIELTDREVFQLIVAAGFSTSEKVTDVSGRGVGMDVVKKIAESLRGDVDILSKTGEGTRFKLRLPLTLAAVDGMVIRDNRQRYIIPTLSVVEAVSLSPDDITHVSGKGTLIKVRNNLIKAMSLSKLLEGRNNTTPDNLDLALIVEESGRKVAFAIDAILGQQQVIIKKIETNIGKIKGISGAAVMPDGQAALVLDISALIRVSL